MVKILEAGQVMAYWLNTDSEYSNVIQNIAFKDSNVSFSFLSGLFFLNKV